MKRVFVALASALLLSAPSVQAHGTHDYGSKDWWPTIGYKKKSHVVRDMHRVFKIHARAHKALAVMLCESQGRYWLRGTYDGAWQANDAFKEAYSPPWWDGWSAHEQNVMAKRGYRARGWQPWPNCGS